MRLQCTPAVVLFVQVAALTRTIGIYAFQPPTGPLIIRSTRRPETTSSVFSTPDKSATEMHTDYTSAASSLSRRDVLFGIAAAIGVTTAEVEVATAQPDQQKGKQRLGGMPNTIRSVGHVMVSDKHDM